ncbi:MAG: hypothetical protein JO331_01965 [Verrucomicrobia bacterium]|nr:hypothetical protein [Verrucomicrobiota bacterium]
MIRSPRASSIRRHLRAQRAEFLQEFGFLRDEPRRQVANVCTGPKQHRAVNKLKRRSGSQGDAEIRSQSAAHSLQARTQACHADEVAPFDSVANASDDIACRWFMGVNFSYDFRAKIAALPAVVIPPSFAIFSNVVVQIEINWERCWVPFYFQCGHLTSARSFAANAGS